MRITSVYTKTGDDGTTGLVGGQRVSKNDARIDAYGTGDELMAVLGWARVELAGEMAQFPDPEDGVRLDALLEFIQNEIFTLNADLATRLADRHPQMKVIGPENIQFLEGVCDRYNGELEPLQDFILPGGSRTAAALHVARTVARRAERCVVTLGAVEDIGPHVATYLNRMSDALFVIGRWVNVKMGKTDPIWRKDLPRPD